MVVNITLSLAPDHATEVYAAVGEQLAKGDVKPEEGETQFSAAIAQALAAAPPPPPPPPPSTSGPMASSDPKKR